MIVKLRNWQIDDAAELVDIIGNKKVQDNLRDGIPFPYKKADAEFFINEMLESGPETVYAFAITADSMLVGSIAVYRQGNIHCRTGEVGYYIGENYWGKGIGTEALKQVCDYIFNETDIIRIFAEPFAYNIASCRILEKAGFDYEGTLKCNAVKNNRMLDMKMYAKIKNEIG